VISDYLGCLPGCTFGRNVGIVAVRKGVHTQVVEATQAVLAVLVVAQEEGKELTVVCFSALPNQVPCHLALSHQ
jgi:hypothetical protein